MSYINRHTRVFDSGPRKEVLPIRSEARMKVYISSTDNRAWCDIVEDRRQHILEYAARNKDGYCPGKLFPIDALVEALLACQGCDVEKLKQRIEYLEKLISIYEQLELTDAQKKQFDDLKKVLDGTRKQLEDWEKRKPSIEPTQSKLLQFADIDNIDSLVSQTRSRLSETAGIVVGPAKTTEVPGYYVPKKGKKHKPRPCKRKTCKPVCKAPCDKMEDTTVCVDPCKQPCQAPCQDDDDQPCIKPCKDICKIPCQLGKEICHEVCKEPCLKPCEEKAVVEKEAVVEKKPVVKKEAAIEEKASPLVNVLPPGTSKISSELIEEKESFKSVPSKPAVLPKIPSESDTRLVFEKESLTDIPSSVPTKVPDILKEEDEEESKEKLLPPPSIPSKHTDEISPTTPETCIGVCAPKKLTDVVEAPKSSGNALVSKASSEPHLSVSSPKKTESSSDEAPLPPKISSTGIKDVDKKTILFSETPKQELKEASDIRVKPEVKKVEIPVEEILSARAINLDKSSESIFSKSMEELCICNDESEPEIKKSAEIVKPVKELRLVEDKAEEEEMLTAEESSSNTEVCACNEPEEEEVEEEEVVQPEEHVSLDKYAIPEVLPPLEPKKIKKKKKKKKKTRSQGCIPKSCLDLLMAFNQSTKSVQYMPMPVAQTRSLDVRSCCCDQKERAKEAPEKIVTPRQQPPPPPSTPIVQHIYAPAAVHDKPPPWPQQAMLDERNLYAYAHRSTCSDACVQSEDIENEQRMYQRKVTFEDLRDTTQEPQQKVCAAKADWTARQQVLEQKPTGSGICSAKAHWMAKQQEQEPKASGICAAKAQSTAKTQALEPERKDSHTCSAKAQWKSVLKALEQEIIPPEEVHSATCSAKVHWMSKLQALEQELENKEIYCAEQRKAAEEAIEQLGSIQNVLKERDDLKRKLEHSLLELKSLKKADLSTEKVSLDWHKPSQHSRHSSPTVDLSSTWSAVSCEEEIKSLEREIELMKSSSHSPEEETKIMRKEVDVLKMYCNKLSTIQQENYRLKSELKKANEQQQHSSHLLNELGLKLGDNLNVGNVLEELSKLNNTKAERDELKAKVGDLEKELVSYNDSPEDIEMFKKRSILLDDVIKDRDRLNKHLEEVRGVEEELKMLRRKSSKMDDMERQLRRQMENNNYANEELEALRCQCCEVETELEHYKAEGDTLRSKLVCMEHELESLKCLCKESELLKVEKDHMKKNLEEMYGMQEDYDDMRNKLKAFNVVKSERDSYKMKYEQMIGLECECDILRAQVEKAKVVEHERDMLEAQVEDLEGCINDQEYEIKKLISQIDSLAKCRDDQQMKMASTLSNMRAELEKKEYIIQSSEEKLASIQDDLKISIQGVHSETTNLKLKNDKLEKEVTDLQRLNKLMLIELQEKQVVIDEYQNHVEANTKALNIAQYENENLQQLVSQSSTGDEHFKELIRQSKCAVQRVCEELSRQYQEWDCIKKKQEESNICTCCKCGQPPSDDDDSDSTSNPCPCNRTVWDCKKTLISSGDHKEKKTTGSAWEKEMKYPTGSQQPPQIIEEDWKKWDCKQNDRMDKLESMLKDATDQITKYKCTCETATAENMALRRHSSEVQEVAKNQIEDLVDHLKKCKDRVSELEGDLQDCVKEKENMRVQITAMQLQVEASAGDSDKIQKLQEQLCNLKHENFELENQLKNNVIICAKRLTKADEKLGDVDELQNMLQKALSDLQNANEEKRKLKEELDKSLHEINDLKQIRDALNKKLLESNANLSDLVNNMGRVLPVPETLTDEDRLKDQKEKEALKSALEDLENQMKNLKKIEKSEPSKELTESINDLTKRVEHEQKRADAAEEALRKLKASDPTAMLMDEMAQLKKKLAELEAENSQLKQNVTMCEKETANLKQQLADSREGKLDVSDLKNEMDLKMKENEKLKADAERAEKDANVAADKLDAAQSEIAKLKEEFGMLEIDKTKLKKDLDTALNEAKKQSEKVDRLEAENAKLKQRVADLEKELERLKKELDAYLNDTQKDSTEAGKIQDEANKLKQENAKGKQKISDLEGEIAKLKKELDSALTTAKKETTDVGQLQDEINKLKQQLSKAESENQKLKDNLDSALNDAKSNLKDIAKTEDENNKLKKNIKDLEDQLAKLKKELEQAQNDLKKTAPEKEENSKLKDRLKQLEAENAKLKEDFNESLDKEKKHLSGESNLTDSNNKLKQLNSKLESDNEKLKKDFKNASDENANFKKRIDNLEKENKDAKAEADGLKKRLADLQNENTKLKSEVDDLKKQLEQMKSDNAKKSDTERRKSIDNEGKLKESVTNLENENAKLRKDLAAARDEIIKLKAQIDQLNKDIDKLKKDSAAADGLKKELDKLKKENDKLNKDIKDAGDDTELKKRLADLQKENDQLNKDMKTVGDDKELRKRLADLQIENAKLSKEAKAAGDNIDLKKQLADLRKENDKLSRDAKAAGDDSELKKQLEDLRKENEKLNKEAKVAGDDAELKKRLAELEKENEKLNREAKAGGDDAELKKRLADLEKENEKLNKIVEAGADDDELKKQLEDLRKENEKLSESKGDEDNLKKQLEELKKENQSLNASMKAAGDEDELKKRLAELEQENKKLNNDLKSAGDSDALKKQLEQLKKERDKLKEDAVGTYSKKECEDEIAKLKKEYNDTIASLKKQFDRDQKNLLDKNAESIGKMQKSSVESINDIISKYEKEIKALQDELRATREQLEGLLKEKEKDTDVEKEDESKKSSKPDICECGEMFEKVLEKILSKGIQKVSADELNLAHTVISSATAKKIKSPLVPKRKKSPERNIMQRQSDTHDKVIYIQKSVQMKKEELEKMKKQIQLQKQRLSLPITTTHPPIAFPFTMEDERIKLRNLEAAVEREKLNTQNLRRILEKEKGRSPRGRRASHNNDSQILDPSTDRRAPQYQTSFYTDISAIANQIEGKQPVELRRVKVPCKKMSKLRGSDK